LSTHYVLHIKVEKVTLTEEKPTGYNQLKETKQLRSIDDLVHLTLKGAEFAKLILQAKAHLDLANDL